MTVDVRWFTSFACIAELCVIFVAVKLWFLGKQAEWLSVSSVLTAYAKPKKCSKTMQYTRMDMQCETRLCGSFLWDMMFARQRPQDICNLIGCEVFVFWRVYIPTVKYVSILLELINIILLAEDNIQTCHYRWILQYIYNSVLLCWITKRRLWSFRNCFGFGKWTSFELRTYSYIYIVCIWAALSDILSRQPFPRKCAFAQIRHENTPRLCAFL